MKSFDTEHIQRLRSKLTTYLESVQSQIGQYALNESVNQPEPVRPKSRQSMSATTLPALPKPLRRRVGEQSLNCLNSVNKRKQEVFSFYKIRHPQLKKNPIAHFAHSLHQKDVMPVPCLAHNHTDSLELLNYKLNYALVSSLCDSLQLLQTLKTVKFVCNGVQEAEGLLLFQCLATHPSVEAIAYEHNALTLPMLKTLSPLVDNNKLVSLSFAKCLCKEPLLRSILHLASELKRLKTLDLHRVSMTDRTVPMLRELFLNDTLEELNLAWNSISSRGGCKLMKMLLLNDSLELLNLSYNNLFSDPKFTEKLAEFILNHPKIIDLNLGNTGISNQDLPILADALKEAPSLHTFHFTGHNATRRAFQQFLNQIPANGNFHPGTAFKTNKVRMRFIQKKTNYFVLKKPVSKDWDSAESTNGEEVLQKVPYGMWTYAEHCWACHGWTYHTFTVFINELVAFTSMPEYIDPASAFAVYCSGLNWEPRPMHFSQNKYSCKVLLPPGRHFVCFGNDQGLFSVNSKPVRRVSAHVFNTLTVERRTQGVREACFRQRSVVQLSFVKSASVFAGYREASRSVYAQMVLSDFAHSEALQQLRQEHPDCVKGFEGHYHLLDYLYTHYAVASGYPYLDFNGLEMFCKETELLDYVFLNMTVVDREYQAVLAKGQSHGLLRHQFAQFVSSIAQAKYGHVMNCQHDVVTTLFQRSLVASIKFDPLYQFFSKNLATFDIDRLLQLNFNALRSIYLKYSTPQPFLTAQSIQTMLEDCSLPVPELNRLIAYTKSPVVNNAACIDEYCRVYENEFFVLVGILAESCIAGEQSLFNKLEEFLHTLFEPSQVAVRHIE